jgi:4-amino-4-deoxy-L-arabinose transferase-like glycosyltransferase
MQTASDRAASPWLRPEFARLLAILWVAGLALVFLIRYDAWLLPFQLAGLISSSLPEFHFGPHFREFWIARGYDAVCVAGIVFAALGLGTTVTDRLIARRDVLGLMFALAAGFWLLAVIVLMAGAVSVAKVPHVFLVLLCWLLPTPRKFVRDFQVSAERIDGWAKLMFASIVLAAVLNLAGAFAPPFEYDELEYHLGALADYQRAGRIVFLPHNFYSNLPQLTEMLYLLATTMTSDVAAKLLHWLFGVLGVLAVYGVARRLWSRNAALTAAALFYCAPFVQDLSQTARVDLATGFFATLAFGALLVWSEEQGRERNWIWLSALCAGAAVATKWTAIPVVLLPALVFVGFYSKSVFRTSVFCLLCSVFIVPWLVKNWFLTGNPVYPLFAAWFPSPHWSAEQAAVFAARHYPKFGWEAVGQFFALAWNYSFVEARAVPVLLMTAPLVLLARWAEPAAKRAAGLFAGAYAGWFCFTFRPWRFLFPAFGMAALAGAHAMEKLGHEPTVRKMMRISVGIVLTVSLAAMALGNFVDVDDPSRVPPQISFVQHALGQSTRDEFVARIGRGVLEPIMWMNKNLPKDAKVLYVGEARAYYAKQSVIWSTAFDRQPLEKMSQEAGTAEELLTALRAAGITHVYVNFSELERLQKGYDYMLDANWGLIRNVLQHHARELHASRRKMVYELNE